MSLTRSALREKGVTEKEVLDYIMEEHGNTLEAAKEKAKETAEAAMQKTIDALQSKIDNAPEGSLDDEGWQAKYEALKTEYGTYKKNIETKAATEAKINAIEKSLSNDGANPKLIKLLVKEFDLNNVTLEGEDIKDWNELSRPIKENYADVFGVAKTEGVAIATPQNFSNGIVDHSAPREMNKHKITN